MKFILKSLKTIIDAVGNICSIIMLLMVLNVFYDVVMRYFFNDVDIGMQELEWHLFAAMFMFGIGYTLKEDGHVRVDVIYDQLSRKKQAIINTIGSLFFALPFTCLILYFSWDYTLDAYQLGEGSADPGGLPYRWIVRSFIPISSIYLMLAIAYVVLEQVQVIFNNTNKIEGEK